MSEIEHITIDGSRGEGGGQIIRTSLSLSLITGRAFVIENIRAKRKSPGLKEQHLTCIRACQKISDAECSGDFPGSSSLYFKPRRVNPGTYHFDIATAGSTSLVLQCIYYPLALSSLPSSVSITGGTHVFWSPSFDYLEQNWLPEIKRIGFRSELTLKKAGYFPSGGGKIDAMISPSKHLKNLRNLFRGRIEKINVLAGSSNLPRTVRERMLKVVRNRMAEYSSITSMEEAELPSQGTNASLCITCKCEHSIACFTDIGERGKPSEKVAENAISYFFDFARRVGAYDLHMADQIMIALSLIPGAHSVYTTTHISQHLITNAEIIQKFLPLDIEIKGREGEEGKITIKSTERR